MGTLEGSASFDPGVVEELGSRIVANVQRAVKVDDAVLTNVLVALFAEGHLLIEDRPGVGKTALARPLARSLGGEFSRIQCTADLLPSEVLGWQLCRRDSGELRFQPGPVFTSVLVADELNRTPPRTQSALLECMAEGAVTVDRTTYPLPDRFFVVATQNPSSSAGTYPLPDSQLDRFLIRITLGYPDAAEECAIVAREDGHRALERMSAVAGAEDLLAARTAIQAVRLQDDVLRYLVELCRRTRESSDVEVGVSPRGAQALHRACRARAALRGRDFVIPDDVQQLALPVLAHRMSVQRGAVDAAAAVLGELLQTVGAPD